MANNGYTQKELLNVVIERLDRLEEKLDAKLDKAEFYKVLTLLVALVELFRDCYVCCEYYSQL